MSPPTTSLLSKEARAFVAAFGQFGETERRQAALTQPKMNRTGTGERFRVSGHAAVFDSPSVEMRSPLGAFTEYVQPHAFDRVIRSNPDVLLLWDHSTLHPLARTNGTLELSANSHGLRFYAEVTPTSYAADLKQLMEDRVVSQASFLFRVAPGGERWETRGDQVIRRIYEVEGLYDVTITAAGAYPRTDSGIARTLALDYATARGLLTTNPDAQLEVERLRAELEIRRRKLTV